MCSQGRDRPAEEASEAAVVTHADAVMARAGKRHGQLTRKNYKAQSFSPCGVYPGANTLRTPRSEGITVQLRLGNASFATSSTVANSYQSAYFTLDSVSSYAAFTNLFDQYRIVSIEAWITPSVTQATSAATEQGQYVTSVDLDDETSGTYTRAQITPGSVETSVLTAHYHKWEPSIAVAAYSGVTTSYGSASNQWLDCYYPSIKHYGLKWNCTSTTTAVTFAAQYRMTVQFRGITTVS